MHKLKSLIIIFAFVSASCATVRKWYCRDKKFCVPVLSSNVNIYTNTSLHQTQELCRLVCGKSRGLWPMPYEIIDLSDNYISVNIDKLSFDYKNVSNAIKPILVKMTNIFKRKIRQLNKMGVKDDIEEELRRELTDANGRGLTIIFSVNSSSTLLDWNTDEGYVLDINSADNRNILAQIDAETIFGARHALESLSQLIESMPDASDSALNSVVMITKALIRDKPFYKHRGLLLDTSRNFLPLKHIRQTIVGMATSKLNVLHWHITDAQSFPLEIPRYPQMSNYGAYSPDHIYTLSDIKSIIDFAKLRGVRVIMEIDAPAHAGFGWQWGEEAGLGKLAVCVNKQPWRSYCVQPPCGQLNPVNPNVNVVMSEVYKGLVKVNDEELNFHMGGDEVHLGCWNSSNEIIQGMQLKGYNRTKEGFLQLWSDFQQEMLNVYDSIVGDKKPKVILWSSELTTPENINGYLSPKRYVIQTWVEKEKDLNKELLDKGYELIISTKNAWYFDHGFWGITQYYGWKKVYANKILADPGVLGGEGCMWGEFVNQNLLHSKIWPRAAALAERLWSDPLVTDFDEVETRLNAQTKRLILLGLTPDALRPEWCLMNEGNCPNYH